MTADEALELIETALNYKRLNTVQELLFRQSWEGRSYKEIAVSSKYKYERALIRSTQLHIVLPKPKGISRHSLSR